MSCRVAIIGGGPGGLLTVYQLQRRCNSPFEVTVYEASDRLGGKVITREFQASPVTYEAGAAELYDYSHVGEDPLRDLVETLGLKIRPMAGPAVILEEKVLESFADAGRVYGENTRRSLEDFHARAERWMSATDFYDSDWRMANADPKASISFEEELMQVPDEAARRFLRVMVHSDLATEPHRTSAAYGLQNYLMNAAEYLRLYTIEGGIEQLITRLTAQVSADVRLREKVTRVTHAPGNVFLVESRRLGENFVREYDFVVAALPNNYLPAIDWVGEPLADAMRRHHEHYDYPAHYLRVSLLFEKPFWRGHMTDSYVMLDAFGGCCLYDESSRNETGPEGVLGWLLAGEAAMTAANRSDDELIAMVIDSLPSYLQHGKTLLVEGRVHRWLGAVNGLPGGRPAEDLEKRHMPDSTRPNLQVVGDYLFDSTLNGVLDSADYVAETIAAAIEARSAIGALQGAA